MAKIKNSSLEVIESCIDIENAASIKLVKKLGFKLDKKIKNYRLIFVKNFD